MTPLASCAGLPTWRARLEEARQHLGGAADGCGAYRELVDELVCTLAAGAGWDRSGAAVVALGGYGRGDLAPHSDLDLLFLLRRADPAAAVEPVLYPLWDLGFDVGHALRTPGECAALAGGDLTVATAFLDGRLLLGDRSLFEQARRRCGIRSGGSRRMRHWARWVIDDVAGRRARFGDISRLLEPHVKEGRGGLRDLQACHWVRRCLLLEADGSEDLAAAAQFVRRVRSALHLTSGRKTDHLTFDYHREVAAAVAPGQPIGAFFEALHRAGQRIAAAWDATEAEASQALLPRRKRTALTAPPPSSGPIAALLGEWCRAGGGVTEEVRLTLTTAARTPLEEALRSVVAELLRSRTPLAPLLRALHAAGRLDLVAPELQRVATQIHYDARHRFTTGVHCLETLAALEDLWLGRREREEPHLSRIGGGILDPAAARLAALCHDLGKGVGAGGHAAAGAPIAVAVARRLGLPEATGAAAARLVEAHHVVPQLAFSADLEDPASWQAARGATSEPGDLDTLVALAYADQVATDPATWDGIRGEWKRDLLITLHARARAQEAGSERPPDARLQAVVAAAAADGGWTLDAETWRKVPRKEAAQVPPDLLGRLLALAGTLGERAAAWAVDGGGGPSAEILGVVQPLPKVLSRATSVLARMGLDILSLQVHRWPDGTAHLWFRVAHPEHPPSGDALGAALTRAVTGEELPLPGAETSLGNPRQEATPVPTRVEILADGNPFHTTLEVRCRDRRGLLRDLTAVYDDLGLTVEYALVTTHGPMAQDVFHLKDIFGGRIAGSDKVQALLAAAREVAGQTT